MSYLQKQISKPPTALYIQMGAFCPKKTLTQSNKNVTSFNYELETKLIWFINLFSQAQSDYWSFHLALQLF